MARRPASITQADVARAVRAAKQAGAAEVEVYLGEHSTAGVENPPRKKGDGFIPWTEEDVATYERCWPIGTRQRVWLDVLLYTGLRRFGFDRSHAIPDMLPAPGSHPTR